MEEMKVRLPRARTDGLMLQSVGEEVIVYDPKSDTTHLLNPTAALIWKQCDGQHTVSALAMQVALATHTSPNEELVQYTLAQLQRKGLMMEKMETAVFASMTRRQALTKFALAAGAVPIIQTLKAPETNQAASCGGLGALCGPNSPCCPPLVCGSAAPFCLGN